MSVTATGLVVTRADGTSLDLPLAAESTLTAGTTCTPPAWDDGFTVGADPPSTLAGTLRVFLEDYDGLPGWVSAVIRNLTDGPGGDGLQVRSGPYAGTRRRVYRVQITFPTDTTLSTIESAVSAWSWVEVTTADVVEELSLADLEALAA